MKLELRMFVQHLGGPTQPVVDHELDASQHTGEEEIHEVEDGSGIHVAFFLSFHVIYARGGENLLHRVFVATHSIVWEQTETITQPRPDLGDVRNELLELRQETIQLALREPTFDALIELLHRGNQRV